MSAVASYRSFIDAAVEVAGSDAGSVQVFDERQGGLRLAGWRGFHPMSAAFWELVVSDSACVCGMSLASGQRVVVVDVETEAALADSEDLEEFRRSRLRAVQSTPLATADGRLLGMLSTHWRTPHEPSAAVLRRIDSLARRCASAIEREPTRCDLVTPVGPQLLREVNKRIHEMSAHFDVVAATDASQEYLCECGCGEWVALTGSEFESRLAAHEPMTRRGHVVARAHAARRRSRTLRSDAAALRAEAEQRKRKAGDTKEHRSKPSDE
jgi:hypothetical protein